MTSQAGGVVLPPPRDHWSHWIFHERHGDDPELAARLLRSLVEYRDRVLDRARLRAGCTVADVGTGDGLVGFGAIERLGTHVRVIFIDISSELLARVAEIARARGVASQCRFIQASAEDLRELKDESADAVTARAVVAYLRDKPAALREFRRILKPGGVLSTCDPVFRDRSLPLASLGELLKDETLAAQTADARLLFRWRARQLPATAEAIEANPLTNFTERDLFRWFREAGFDDVHARLHIDTKPAMPHTWEALLRSSPYPGAPTLETILHDDFTPEERERLAAHWRRLRETARVDEETNAYMWATK